MEEKIQKEIQAFIGNDVEFYFLMENDCVQITIIADGISSLFTQAKISEIILKATKNKFPVMKRLDTGDNLYFVMLAKQLTKNQSNNKHYGIQK